MTETLISVGGLDPSHAIAERLHLPLLDGIGAVSTCFQAIDSAATLRRGIAVIGPKGSGKSVGLETAIRLFGDIERGKNGVDNTYRPRRVLHAKLMPRADYRESALAITRGMSKNYAERVRGRKKTNPEIVQDAVALCRTQRQAVIVVDEADECTEDTLVFLRDLMAGIEQLDRQQDEGASRAAGVGVVIVGDATLESRLESNKEAMHRWALTLHVPTVTAASVASLLVHWFPGFRQHVLDIGEEAWRGYISGAFGGSQQLNLRLVENAARLYALHVTRRRLDITDQAHIPFVHAYFEKALQEVTWAAPEAIEASARVVRPRLGRREK
jgi:type II secretory pathway predicted ATPase ExeA